MGGGLFVFPIILVGLLLLLALGAWIVWAGRQSAAQKVPAGTPALEYEVPSGQDPVVVLAALSQEGYSAAADPVDHQRIRIACPLGADQERPHVRHVIGSVHTTAIDAGAPMDPGPVTFVDER